MRRIDDSRDNRKKCLSTWNRAARSWNRATRPRPSLPRTSDLLQDIQEGRVRLPQELSLGDAIRSRRKRGGTIARSASGHRFVVVSYSKRPDEGALVRLGLLILRLNVAGNGQTVDGAVLIAPDYSIWTYETARELNANARFRKFRLYVGERRRGTINIRRCRAADCAIPRWADIRDSFKLGESSG